MNRERATIVALIIALFSLMIIFISIEREVSNVKALESKNKVEIKKLSEDIDKLKKNKQTDRKKQMKETRSIHRNGILPL